MFFSPLNAYYHLLGFVQGVFFETLICVSIGFKFFELTDYLSPGDRFSLGWQMICLFILLVYIGFSFYFTFITIPRIVIKYRADMGEKYKQMRETIHREFKS